MLYELSNLGCLKVQGNDTKKFLQGQLTCDLELVNSNQLCLGAHCNPQGRVISLFYIFIFQDNYYLLMQKDMLDIAMSALKKYAIFFKVEMSKSSSEDVDLIKNVETMLQQKFLQHKFSVNKINEWEYLNIQNEIPIIYPETSEKFLPHEINLDKLNALSFNKGCYTGQEIIARMHYKGKLKSRVYKAIINSDVKPLLGSDIYSKENAEEKICGMIINACLYDNNYHALVMLTAFQNNLFVNKNSILILDK